MLLESQSFLQFVQLQQVSFKIQDEHQIHSDLADSYQDYTLSISELVLQYLQSASYCK